ncbi:hypothetical protein NPA08_02735 [Mycoplasmopsis citelli]|uniref:MAG3720 family protein n=1 Tax=Mycoplasmopsis citelli TaxID=171281 RepID=UPI0021156594|nr:hypothetical protein [Mycoplasmopsis citelli]UUD35862.1 hypothetical protein NPA08_02735 [Mycoplasmopsis citelli]
MEKLFGNFHISKKQISFALVKQVNGNYLHCDKIAPKVIFPTNVDDVENFIIDIKNSLDKISNKYLYVNVVIDDSQLNDLNVNLIKNTLESDDIIKLDDAPEAMEQLISQQIQKLIQTNNWQLVGTKVTYEYLLYKANNQIKVYHQFPRGKKFTKIIAKTSFCYQTYDENYNKIISLFQALPSEQFNVILTSQAHSAKLKNISGVNLSVEINDDYTLLKLVYNGAIISYRKLLVGTDNLIFKIASKQKITLRQATNKVKYIINKNDNTQTWTDQNLSNAYIYLKIFGDFLELQMKNFVNWKYISPEKLNTLSFSGVSDWMNSYFEKMYFLPTNLGFINLWKHQGTLLNYKLQKIQEPITLGVMSFLENFVFKEHNTVNTISSHYDLKNTKKQRFLLFRELFANFKLL